MSKPHRQLKSYEEIIEHQRMVQEHGFDFPLTATSLGMDEVQVAQVRRATISNQVSFDLIPNDLQNIVNEGLAYIENERKRVEAEGESTETLRDRMKNASRFLPAADAFCVATFVNPKIVRTEAERLAHPGSWIVTAIDPADRIDWFWACLSADSEAAKKLKLFRDESSIDVQGRTVSNDDGPTTVQPSATTLRYEPESESLLPMRQSSVQ